MNIKLEPVEDDDSIEKYRPKENSYDLPVQPSEPTEGFQEIMLTIKSEDDPKDFIVKEERTGYECAVKNEDFKYGVEICSTENEIENKFQSSKQDDFKTEAPTSSFPSLPCQQNDTVEEHIKNELPNTELVPVIALEKKKFCERNFVCKICFHVFESEILLKTHSIDHNVNSKLKSHKCDRCSYQTGSGSHFKRHQIKHSNKKPFECDRCSFKTADSSSLKRHQVTHTGYKPFKCNQCSFETARSSHLKRHEYIHISKDLLKCDKCYFETKTMSLLKRHQLKHSDQKLFDCDRCDFKSARSSHLKRHQITHSSNKLLKCDQCDFETAHLYSLTRHQVIHSGKKPFKCERCNFETVQLSSLKRHQITHSGQKPHKCGECSFETAQFSSLKRHQIIHAAK